MQKPTDKELEILQVLWREGASTVRQVNEQLNHEEDAEVGYTTTLKLMQIMHQKGMLSRSLSGKTHTYTALISENEARQALMDRLIDKAFEGSAMRLVMQALGSRKATEKDLQEIRAFLEAAAKETE